MDNTTEPPRTAACASPLVDLPEPTTSWRSRLRRARKETAALHARITAACAAGQTHRARGLQRRYLSSFSARLCAVVEADHSLPPYRRLQPEALVRVAEELDAWQGTDEEVKVHAFPRGYDSYRTVMAFGLRNRALQILARRALAPFVDLHPSQFAVLRGGRNAAAAEVRRALPDGYKWAIEVDIERCFASFKPQEVTKSLPLPRRVAETVLVSTRLNLIEGNIRHTQTPISLLCTSRRGIPQGSKASPLVAEMLLAPTFARLPKEVRVVVYVDNILILGKAKRDVLKAKKALSCALAQSPVGWLRLKFGSRLRRVCDGFDFLGYRFRRKAGHVFVRASDKNRARFWAKCEDVMGKLAAGKVRPGALRELVCSWAGAFQEWDGVHLWTGNVVKWLTVHQFHALQPVVRMVAA